MGSDTLFWFCLKIATVYLIIIINESKNLKKKKVYILAGVISQWL
jgi:hypothetical protein